MVDKFVSVKRKPHALYCDDISLTKQSFKKDCDINVIIARARSGADVSHLNARVPMYADVSNVPDYRNAMDIVNRANDMFMGLSAEVRRYFGNDAGKFVEFCSDPKNRDEVIRLGLAKAPEEPVVQSDFVPDGTSVGKAVKPVVEPKGPPKGPLGGVAQ